MELCLYTLIGIILPFMAIWKRIGRGQLDFLTTIVLPAGVLIFLVTRLSQLTVSYRVTTEEIRVRSIWGSRRIPWGDVEEIRFRTNFFGGLGLHIIRARGTPRWNNFMLPLVGNDHEIGKAVIEAAMLAPHHIKVRGSPETTYGPPPYGIFLDPGSPKVVRSAEARVGEPR